MAVKAEPESQAGVDFEGKKEMEQEAYDILALLFNASKGGVVKKSNMSFVVVPFSEEEADGKKHLYGGMMLVDPWLSDDSEMARVIEHGSLPQLITSRMMIDKKLRKSINDIAQKSSELEDIRALIGYKGVEAIMKSEAPTQAQELLEEVLEGVLEKRSG